MKYYLGVDGGGTKTALCLINEKLEVIKSVVVGPSSLDTITIENSVKTIVDGFNQLNFKEEICSIFVGLGGTNKTNLVEFTKLLKKEKCFNKAIINTGNDVINALYGSLGGEDGIVIICGTGSVVYGINNGLDHRCGGYAWQEGDYGSSYNLGRQSLKYLAKVIDKRLPSSSFSDDLQKKLNITDFDSLANFFVTSNRTTVAQIARIVTANQDNEIAKKIIENSIDELVIMIDTVYKQLNFNKCNLGVIGSLGNADTYFKEYLKTRLFNVNSNIKIVENKYDADYGAALKAYKENPFS